MPDATCSWVASLEVSIDRVLAVVVPSSRMMVGSTALILAEPSAPVAPISSTFPFTTIVPPVMPAVLSVVKSMTPVEAVEPRSSLWPAAMVTVPTPTVLPSLACTVPEPVTPRLKLTLSVPHRVAAPTVAPARVTAPVPSSLAASTLMVPPTILVPPV